MSRSVQDLLKKINYIEADIEIQKQILFSLPADSKDEIAQTLTFIAGAKKQIQHLRREIKEISPKEYQKIVNIENGINAFREVAAKKDFTSVEQLDSAGKCHLYLKDGTMIDCLVKAMDSDLHWTVLTSDGEVLFFAKEDVRADT